MYSLLNFQKFVNEAARTWTTYQNKHLFIALYSDPRVVLSP